MKTKLTILSLLLSVGVAMGQGRLSLPNIRYSKALYKSTIYTKYFTYINDTGDLKYLKTDTLSATAIGSTKETQDKKGYWYSTSWDFPSFSDYHYYLGGKEVFPVDIKRQENIMNAWSYIKTLDK